MTIEQHIMPNFPALHQFISEMTNLKTCYIGLGQSIPGLEQTLRYIKVEKRKTLRPSRKTI